GINVADEVGDGDVGRGQLLDVALLRRQIGNGRGLTLLADEFLATAADGSVGIVVDLATGDVRQVRVEQAGEGAQDAAFGLAAQAEQDEIVPGEDSVDDLRHHSVVVTHDSGKQR